MRGVEEGQVVVRARVELATARVGVTARRMAAWAMRGVEEGQVVVRARVELATCGL
jgi:hypothetical protein